MKIKYIAKRFTAKSKVLIQKANAIISEYAGKGYSLTLRQLYYQFVARGLITNNMKSYKKLGYIVNDGRLTGLIDWDAITDRSRYVRTVQSWSRPKSILEAAVSQYRVDRWKGSLIYMEVWVEKEALIDVVQRACREYDIPCFACKGYVSQSEMWEAAQRMTAQKYDRYILLHFGDHDPSGIDMTRDIEDRLAIFGCPAEVKRIALNIDQVRKYNPPPNPAKMTDTRYQAYIDHFGTSSWELDALDPDVIRELIVERIKRYMPLDIREANIAEEKEELRQLDTLLDVIKFDDLKDVAKWQIIKKL